MTDRAKLLEEIARFDQEFGLIEDDEWSEKHRSPRFLPGWWILPFSVAGAAFFYGLAVLIF